MKWKNSAKKNKKAMPRPLAGPGNSHGRNWKTRQGFVFVSVGTHPQQFDRLLAGIDWLVEKGKIKENVFAQTGYSAYAPKKYEAKKFIGLAEFEKMVRGCSLFITHAGEGNIGLAKNLGKKFICVPRRKEFGEHTNDHQLELAKVVDEKKLGLVAWSTTDLEAKIEELGGFMPADVPRGRINQILENYFSKGLQ